MFDHTLLSCLYIYSGQIRIGSTSPPSLDLKKKTSYVCYQGTCLMTTNQRQVHDGQERESTATERLLSVCRQLESFKGRYFNYYIRTGFCGLLYIQICIVCTLGFFRMQQSLKLRKGIA